MSSNLSKLEAIKEVCRVLVRHGVDTTQVHFYCHGKSLLLTGGLYKNGELDNWNITDGSISKKGSSPSEQKEKKLVLSLRNLKLQRNNSQHIKLGIISNQVVIS